MYSLFLIFAVAAVILSPLALDIALTVYENRAVRRRLRRETQRDVLMDLLSPPAR